MYFDLPYTKCNFILTYRYVVLAKNTYIAAEVQAKLALA